MADNLTIPNPNNVVSGCCNNKQCQGILQTTFQCSRSSINGTKYCKFHAYFENFNETQIAQIKANTSKKCPKCGKWHFDTFKNCDVCTIARQKQRTTERENKKVCEWFTAEKKKCSHEALTDFKMCVNHQYAENYTQEQINRSKLCTKCVRIKDCGIDENGNLNTLCENCNDKIQIKRDEDKNDENAIKKNKEKKIKAKEKRIIDNEGKKCEWLDRNSKNCIQNKFNDTLYCKFHQYALNYTQEQKDRARRCTGCSRYIDCGIKSNGVNYANCFACRNKK